MWDPKSKIIILIFPFLIHNGGAFTRIDPLVETKLGLIRGLRASDGDYSMFMGIPYATVNESNPFGPSKPHPGFDETFEAYDDSSVCPQVEEFGNSIVGSLDCLRLNVYVPNTANSQNPLAVMVWIHGGSFRYGSGGRQIHGPRFLVKQDIILVTLNYRLGPYGFMCLGTTDVPGNQGFKDQQLALRWIKDNIGSFGGDTNKITIFGESAGGASVDFHLIYGQENLFDKVIIQSGTSVSPWGLYEPDTSAPLKLAENLGLPTSDTDEALEFLARTDLKLVLASAIELNLQLRPCVEQHFDDVETFIYDYPINIQNSNLGRMPILIGHTSDEMSGFFERTTSEEYAVLNVFYDTLKDAFNFENDDLVEMETYIRHFYIGDEAFSAEVEQDLTIFASDFNFNYPAVRTINKYVNSGATNVYYYVFSYDGDRPFFKILNNITSPGAGHADEIGYLFDVSFMDQKPSDEDQLIIDRITTLWTNFAKYGQPVPQVTELLPVQWPAVTKQTQYYLNIDSELEVKKRIFKQRMTMWNLFYKINEKFQIGYRDTDE
ncbi:unnamed protein product [Arctia plantaginis]|uniref:Carboxylic ester hydrolase n=1 Tax=Arctia plantaginis TaxID=874455 RepID=A0A8S1B248_ARCPL|nr:unnamed protein product [Arctia plantaginis]